MTISRPRRSTERVRPSRCAPQGCMAAAMAGLRANIRKRAIGGTPAGIIERSCSSTAGSNGASSGAIRASVSRILTPRFCCFCFCCFCFVVPSGFCLSSCRSGLRRSISGSVSLSETPETDANLPFRIPKHQTSNVKPLSQTGRDQTTPREEAMSPTTPVAGTPRPGVHLGSPTHGGAGPPRPALDTAHPLGAARRQPRRPRPAGPLRRHVLERPLRPPEPNSARRASSPRTPTMPTD